jgi:hypothetical protein
MTYELFTFSRGISMNRFCTIAFLIFSFAAGLFAQTDSLKAPASLGDLPSAPTDKEVFLWGGHTLSYLPEETRQYWKHGWNVVEYNRSPFDETGYRTAMAERYPGQAAAIRSAKIDAKGAAHSLSAMIEFKGSFSPSKHSAAPYFLLGVGYMRFASDSIAMEGSSSYTVPENSQGGIGWTVGLGIEVPVTGTMAVFAQARSVIGELDKSRQYFPLNAGLRLTL